jgi:hypothetical protein
MDGDVDCELDHDHRRLGNRNRERHLLSAAKCRHDASIRDNQCRVPDVYGEPGRRRQRRIDDGAVT